MKLGYYVTTSVRRRRRHDGKGYYVYYETKLEKEVNRLCLTSDETKRMLSTGVLQTTYLISERLFKQIQEMIEERSEKDAH